MKTKKRKLSNQFLKNYLVVFILTVTATALAFSLLSAASGLIAGTLAKNRFPASALIKADYTQIDASGVVENGGGVQIVNRDYRVVFSSGLNTIGKTQLSTGEFTEFLTESEIKPCHYDILYQPEGEFWLIVTFPTSLRLDFSLMYNPDAAPGDFARVVWVIAAVAGIYLLLLALITYIYSRVTASAITGPLQKLCDGTKLLREGDYSARVELHLKNEFAELQDTFNDMAAKLEQETALRKKAEDDRKRLIVDISHDLKNPLTGIMGYSELCLNQPEPTAEQRGEYLRVIYQNSQRADQLLSELFELSKMDSPDFALKTQQTDLCEYLRQIGGELVPLLERAGFAYEFDIPEERVSVMLDEKRFGRILYNLADNAIRYNPPGTKVSIALVKRELFAEICFCDDGCGIPVHLAQDIFDPFVRADDSRNSKTGGSGLGLSIARKIARAHGGDLTLMPDTEKGSRFVLTIPITVETGSQ